MSRLDLLMSSTQLELYVYEVFIRFALIHLLSCKQHLEDEWSEVKHWRVSTQPAVSACRQRETALK